MSDPTSAPVKGLRRLLARLSSPWRALTAKVRARRAPRAPRAKRVRVPTVLQMEAVECGAACLAMILARFGKRAPLEELRAACGVSRDGSKASNVVKAARRYGLVAKGFRKEPKHLREMAMPAIIHWNFNHFVVLEGFGRNKVWLNDPGRGPTAVTEEELDTAFTGVTLTFERGPDFEPGGSKRTLVATLLPRLRGSWLGLTFVVLAGLGLLVPGILAPSFLLVFLDDILVRGLDSWLKPLLIVMGITAVVQIGLSALRQRYLLRFENKLALVTSCRFFWHVLRLPVEFYHQRFPGEVGNRVAINDRVANLLSGQMATTVLDLVVIAFYATVMVQYDLLLTTVSVTIALINLVALRLVSRKRVDLNQRQLMDRGSLMGVAMGGLQTIETLKATGAEPDFFSRWAGHLAKVINSGQKLAVANQVLAVLPPLLLAINSAVLLGLGGLRVMEGHLSMGMLMAFQALMFAFIAPVNRMVALGSTLQEVEGDLARLDDVLSAELDHTLAVDPSDAGGGDGPDEAALVAAVGGGTVADLEELGEGAARATKLAGALELRGVSFGYSRLEKPLITGFDLRVTPGSRVALVGGSGSGKSTISKLVAGLYEPWDGEVLLDGTPRQQLPRQVINNSLALVDQDIFLFEGSVRDNLTLWDTSIPESAIHRAARDAAILDDVTARPKGFSSPIHEGGMNFSGGQRQRLEIARALVGNPSILVLDEATSALDPTTEKIIDDHLRRRGVTCLIVAHRLSTIRDCDEILVMEKGTVVERGTHDQLMAQGGAYENLISAE